MLGMFLISLASALDCEIIRYGEQLTTYENVTYPEYVVEEFINETWVNVTYPEEIILTIIKSNDTGGVQAVKCYSEDLGDYITKGFEGTDKFDDCKETDNGELWVNNGTTLNFNCTDYINYEDYLQKKMQQNIDFRLQELNPPLENSTFDVVQAHDYQYGSAGWNETYTPAQLRTALEKISVNDDGSINKTSYPEQLVSCVGDTCYLQMGKTQSFIIVLLQMVNDWISGIADRVTGTENRLDTIEEDLCNQGFTKYC